MSLDRAAPHPSTSIARGALQRTSLGFALAVLGVATLPGCIYDGSYLVRGTVSAARASAPAPLAGAQVVVMAHNRTERSRQAAATAPDGTYQARYLFGGMRFLVFTSGDGDPILEFTAPGYRTCTVQLRGEGEQAGVIRRPCRAAGRCYALDVILAPEDARDVGACH